MLVSVLRGIYVPTALQCVFLVVQREELVVLLLVYRVTHHEGMGVTYGTAAKDTGPIPGPRQRLRPS